MSILRYVRHLDDLANPRGPLSEVLQPREISEANKQVQAPQQAKSNSGQKKCEPYNKYDDAQRAAIGKYACQHGPAAAARRFSKTLGNSVSKNTVKSIKKAYVEEMQKRPRNKVLNHLPPKK